MLLVLQLSGERLYRALDDRYLVTHYGNPNIMNNADRVPMRPMGQPGSVNWHAIIDAAEDTLREEGFRALTSRRIAERAGFKQRLVYYYFKTMDHLIVEAFRRLSVRELERLDGAVHSAEPLHEIWRVCVRTLDPRLISEFMALANRVEPLRQEVIYFIKESRRLQEQALAEALARTPGLSAIGPKTLAILGTSVALNLMRERDLGIDLGHAGVTELIDQFITAADTESAGVSST